MSSPVIGQMPNVPLVGQGFELKEWFCVIVVECKHCDTRTPVIITAAPGHCRSCGAEFQLVGLLSRGQPIAFNELGFAIAHGMPRKGGDA